MSQETTIKAIHFRTDGTVVELNINKDNMLAELQEAVGGYIEFVYLHKPMEKEALVVNEEGRLLNLPKNPHFTYFYGDVVLIKVNHLLPF